MMSRSLLLFDIDGTLLKVRGDVVRSMVRELLDETLGYTGDMPEMEYHGKTDRQIFLELCEIAGIDRNAGVGRFEELERAIVDKWNAYLLPDTVELLPGVPELLERLSKKSNVTLGVLTGNLEAAARLKLSVHGLETYFSIGSYGSDAIDRTELPPIALRRAEFATGVEHSFERTLIIGDSHRDIECARAWEIRCLAVATGSLSSEHLRRHAPAAVVESLLDDAYIFDFIDA